MTQFASSSIACFSATALFAHDSLDVLAREIPHALDRDRIEYALTSAVQQALSLRCAVLFEQRGDHFTVVADTHWPPSATSIPQDDPAIQRDHPARHRAISLGA